MLTAKAYAQIGNSAGALAGYRRIYFFAPAAAEAADAATSITRLSSTTAAASAAEALARAEKLYAAKRYSESYDAYTSGFTSFPAGANAALQARRAIAAANARRFLEAAAALNASPAPAGEARAEAMFNLAVAYG